MDSLKYFKVKSDSKHQCQGFDIKEELRMIIKSQARDTSEQRRYRRVVVEWLADFAQDTKDMCPSTRMRGSN